MTSLISASASTTMDGSTTGSSSVWHVGGPLWLPPLQHTQTLSPLVTMDQQLIILPQRGAILQVRAFATGQRLGVLVIPQDPSVASEDDDDTTRDDLAKNNNNNNNNNKNDEAIHHDDNDDEEEQGDNNEKNNGSNDNEENEDKSTSVTRANDGSSSLEITATALTATMLVVACTNGNLYCFNVKQTQQALRHNAQSSHIDAKCGHGIPGPIVTPHRVWTLASADKHDDDEEKTIQPFCYLATASPSDWIYGLRQVECTKKEKHRGQEIKWQLCALQWNPNKEPVLHSLLDSNHLLTMDTVKSRAQQHAAHSPVVNLHVRTSSPNEHLVVMTRMAMVHMFRVQTTPSHQDTPTATLLHQMTWNPLPHAPYVTNMVVCTAMGRQALAIGLESGEIRLYPQFVSSACTHQVPTSATKKKDKTKAHVTSLALRHRTLHWHAQAVTTLCFSWEDTNGTTTFSNDHDTYTDETLYSGGHEAVLCTWQAGGGTSVTGGQQQHDKPTHVLPRLARQSLSAVQHTATGHVLVAAADQSLQLVSAHNQIRQWRIQGWPAVLGKLQESGTNALTKAQASRVCLLRPHGSSRLLATGLPAAPGQVIDYDTRTLQVCLESSVTVVSYNTVSRTERSQKAWPPPMVTHAVMAKQTLATVHTVPTEVNSTAQQQRGKDDPYVSPGILKFWHGPSTADPTQPYEAVAVVTEPHGPNSPIVAMALSPSGRFCCTLSCQGDDKSFRLWQAMSDADYGRKGEDEDHDEKKEDKSANVSWAGRYRVGLPAGYANLKVGAVTFSSDDSVLAIAFGNIITFWDVRRGAFIVSLNHVGDRPVKTLQFITQGPFTDTLMSFSDQAIALQSPFGAGGAANVGWTWELPQCNTSCLTQALVLPNAIVVTLYDKVKGHTVCLIIDIQEGNVRQELILHQKSRVVALAAADENDDAAVSFYAMTMEGNLFRLSTHDSTVATKTKSEAAVPQIERNQAPIVAPLASVPTRERKRTAIVLTPDIPEAKRRPTSLVVDEDGMDIDGLPRLKGSVTRWFLGRHLQRP